MSKIAKKPVSIKPGVTINLEGDNIKVNGPKGELNFKIPKGISVNMEENMIKIVQGGEADSAKAGLVRSLVNNMVLGVSSGFEKKLELTGVGYRATANGNKLILSLGFSHPVNIDADQSINFSVEENIITVKGADKALVGNTAAQIRSIRPPEPYKGKGIKYVGEHIRRKVGKAAKALGATK